MSTKIEEDSVYLKYAKIWNKIKSILNVKFQRKCPGNPNNYTTNYSDIKE